MRIIVNPETRTIHIDPRDECNLDEARADPGRKPYRAKVADIALLIADGHGLCQHCCTDDD